MKLIFYISTIFSVLTGFAQMAADTTVDVVTDFKPDLQNYSFPDFKLMDTSLSGQYPFIHFDQNKFAFYSTGSNNFEILYSKLNELKNNGKGKLNFYHIGGSHLQADIYTHDVRTNLQTCWTGASGERGWVFPFDLAHTNNPANYEFSSPNTWTAYRSVVHSPEKYDIDYGLMGALVTCKDSIINIYFRHDRTDVKPPFTHLRIFHNIGEFPYSINFGEDEILVWKTKTSEESGFTDVYFTDPIDMLDLQFEKETEHAPELEIYGFIFMNDNPGISYTSIGINGAGLYTYLENTRFEEQLKSYPPDFFAFSVGTNDGNVPYDKFDPQVYKKNLEKVMQMVLRANPDCALLLTVPNDAYYYRKYPNKNIAREREVIIELAREYNMAVWDFYGIMGELGSSRTWKLQGLMQSDYVHFTSPGYHLKGALYYDAFLKYFDQMELFVNNIQQ